MVNESNITNKERTQKQIEGIIKSYNSKIDPKDCKFSRTSRGNWRAETNDGKRVCVISKFVMNDDIAQDLGYYTPEPEPPTNDPEPNPGGNKE